MNKKGQTLPRNYVYGIVIFVLVIVGGTFLITQFMQSNAGFVNDEQFSRFNSTFNKQSEAVEQIGSMRSSIENASPDFGIFGVLNGLINTAWNGLKFLFTGFGFMDNIFGGLSSIFGIPPFFGDILSLLVVVLFVFAIWSAFFQKDV